MAQTGRRRPAVSQPHPRCSTRKGAPSELNQSAGRFPCSSLTTAPPIALGVFTTAGPRSVLAKTSKADEAISVQLGNSTHELGKEEKPEYIDQHWATQAAASLSASASPRLAYGSKRLIVATRSKARSNEAMSETPKASALATR